MSIDFPFKAPILKQCQQSSTSIHKYIRQYQNLDDEYHRIMNNKNNIIFQVQTNQISNNQHNDNKLQQQKIIKQLIQNICMMKQCVINNPQNYNNNIYGHLAFAQIYELIIDFLSNDVIRQLSPILYNMLAVMTKYWVTDPHNFKLLYNGILQLIQQREYCLKNCLYYLRQYLQVLQQHKFSQQQIIQIYKSQQKNNKNKKINSQWKPKGQTFFQQYFINHFLNQFLGLGSIFLDRTVIRNNQKNRKKSNENQLSDDRDSFVSPYHPIQNNSNSMQMRQSIEEISHSDSELQLYKIKGEEQLICLLLDLIQKCITYDFQHLCRTSQQDTKHLRSAQIILPTKFSKYSKFQEFDLFLKEEHVTQMLNYLFLVLKHPSVKLIIMKLLSSMAKIHFRYFRNKMSHRIYLENLVLVISNLIIGLDFQVNQDITNYLGNWKGLSYKIELAISFGEVLNTLLIYQPTVYSLDPSIIENLLETIHTFIINQLFSLKLYKQKSYKPKRMSSIPQQSLSENQEYSCQNIYLIKMNDLIILIDLYINLLPKVQKMCMRYLYQNQKISDLLNDIMFIVGKNYKDFIKNLLFDHDDCFLVQQISSVECLKILLQFFSTYNPKFYPIINGSATDTSILLKQNLFVFFDWLCNFQHKIQFTTSYHKHCSKKLQKEWQIQNYFEQLCDMVIFFNDQLINPYKQIFCKISQQNINNSIRRFYIIALTYINKSILKYCRCIPSQYLQQINFNIINVIQWILRHKAFDKDLVNTSVYILQYSKNLDSIVKDREMVTQQILMNAQFLKNIYREIDIELIITIILGVCEPQHFQIYRRQFRAIFGLSKQNCIQKYRWLNSEHKKHIVLSQMLQILKQDRHKYLTKIKYHTICNMFKNVYIGLNNDNDETLIGLSQNLIKMHRKLSYSILDILDTFLSQQMNSFNQQQQIEAICRICPIFNYFIMQQNNSQFILQSTYVVCLRAMNKLLLIISKFKNIIFSQNQSTLSEIDKQKVSLIYSNILNSVKKLIQYLCGECNFCHLNKQNNRQVLHAYLELCQVCMNNFYGQTLGYIYKQQYNQVFMSQKVVRGILSFLQEYEKSYGQNWLQEYQLGGHILQQIYIIFICNKNIENGYSSNGQLVRILVRQLRKQVYPQKYQDAICFRKLIVLFAKNTQLLCQLNAKFIDQVRMQWADLCQWISQIDRRGIQSVIQDVKKIGTSQVYYNKHQINQHENKAHLIQAQTQDFVPIDTNKQQQEIGKISEQNIQNKKQQNVTDQVIDNVTQKMYTIEQVNTLQEQSKHDRNMVIYQIQQNQTHKKQQQQLTQTKSVLKQKDGIINNNNIGPNIINILQTENRCQEKQLTIQQQDKSQ